MLCARTRNKICRLRQIARLEIASRGLELFLPHFQWSVACTIADLGTVQSPESNTKGRSAYFSARVAMAVT